MNKDLQLAYEILDKVYNKQTYLNLAMQTIEPADITPLATKLIYGTLERDIELEYYVNELAPSKPNVKIMVILKLAIYAILYIDSMPDYAVVNEAVELLTMINKTPLKPFVNAVLNKFVNNTIELPRNKYEKLSVIFAKPEWLIRAYYKQYGEEQATELLSATADSGREHARYNSRLIDKDGIEKLFRDNEIDYEPSKYGGYFIKNSSAARELFERGLITFQSPSSMLVVRAIGEAQGKSVLDMCSSPGGKAIYLSELYPNATITACDIHEHRVRLIANYAYRMKAKNINFVQSDATIFDEKSANKYDIVMCDAPCSGLGVAHKKPDILLGMTYEDIVSLSELQYKILNNGIDYCKSGGVILYSTCTMLREENYNIIGKTLNARHDVVLEKLSIDMENDGFIQLFPKEGLDGFFIAKLRKI